MALHCHDSDDTTATTLLKEISVEIQGLYMEYMAYNFPQSNELVKFLSDASMSRYAPILARHSIRSVQSFSTLDAATGCLASVAKEAAKGSNLSPEVESKLLLDSVAIAKNAPLAQSIKARFDKYIDRDASFLTAVFSSSGLDMVYSKSLGKCSSLAIGLFCFAVFYNLVIAFDFDDPYCDENPAINAVWTVMPNILFWAIGTFAFLVSSAVSLADPKSAKFVLLISCLLMTLRLAIFDIHLFDKHIYQRCPGNASNYIVDCCFGGKRESDWVRSAPASALANAIVAKYSMSEWRIRETTLHVLYIFMYLFVGSFCVCKQSLVVVTILGTSALYSFVSYTVLLRSRPLVQKRVFQIFFLLLS
jgi:hypothetical protein